MLTWYIYTLYIVTTIVLPRISSTSHNYHIFFVIRTINIYSVSNFEAFNRVISIITLLCNRSPGLICLWGACLYLKLYLPQILPASHPFIPSFMPLRPFHVASGKISFFLLVEYWIIFHMYLYVKLQGKLETLLLSTLKIKTSNYQFFVVRRGLAWRMIGPVDRLSVSPRGLRRQLTGHTLF